MGSYGLYMASHYEAAMKTIQEKDAEIERLRQENNKLKVVTSPLTEKELQHLREWAEDFFCTSHEYDDPDDRIRIPNVIRLCHELERLHRLEAAVLVYDECDCDDPCPRCTALLAKVITEARAAQTKEKLP